MIKIAKYSAKLEEQLTKLDTLSSLAVRFHRDVIATSVVVAMNGRAVVGVGYLKAGATFLKVDELDLPYYFIHAEFVADKNATPEIQVEASLLLIEELKNRFNAIQEQYNGKRLILRLWCNSQKVAYQGFLMECGFRPMRITTVMVKGLSDEDISEDCGNELITKDGERLSICEKNPYDRDFMDAYTATNREAFEVEDSEEELKFTFKGSDAHVFAVMKGTRVIAAVTTWRFSEKRAATENIFCASDYRRKGVTSGILGYVFGYLCQRGYEEASLTVFGDNQPATQLYLGLGYEVEGNLLELHYEKDYKNRGF